MATISDRKLASLTRKHRDAGTSGNYSDSGCRNLRVQISKNGRAYFFFRAQINKKRREKSLGAYPLTSLKEARLRANLYNSRVALGADPFESKQAIKGDSEGKNTPQTFRQAAEKVIKTREDEGYWAAGGDMPEIWRNSMTNWVYDFIGDKKLENVTKDDVRKLLTQSVPGRPNHIFWDDMYPTAKKVRQRIKTVFDVAIELEWTSQANPAAFAKNTALLGNPKHKVKHYSYLPHEQMQAFMAELRTFPEAKAKALELVILTATRTADVRKMRWDEVDLRKKTFTIPEESKQSDRRHKTGKQFRIPLPPRALEILKELKVGVKGELVFPGSSVEKPIHENILNGLIKDMSGEYLDVATGRTVTTHGFRTSFRQWAMENKRDSRDAELCLSHSVDEQVKASYTRPEEPDHRLKQRRVLLTEWENFCRLGKLAPVGA
jgi:integrase|tara:strand:+ start:1110 stop:2414 length:1305 start_codon:yes stop_codon:yes gene_type:complete